MHCQYERLCCHPVEWPAKESTNGIVRHCLLHWWSISRAAMHTSTAMFGMHVYDYKTLQPSDPYNNIRGRGLNDEWHLPNDAIQAAMPLNAQHSAELYRYE